MKRIKIRTLRSILFLLLALVFTVLAVLEGLPKVSQSTYTQEQVFTVTSRKEDDGAYTHLVTGSIRNNSSNPRFLEGIVVRFSDTLGGTFALEFEVGTMAAGEVRSFSGNTTSNAPAVRVTGVSTSALSGDLPIERPVTGLQLSKGFIIFAVLAVLSFGMSLFFAINRLMHRKHHHHHHHHKSSKGKTENA